METIIELKPLPSPDSPIEQNEPPKQKKPRLTLKMLNELIQDLQRENGELMQRVEQLERQLEELHRIHEEVAATTEMTMDMPQPHPQQQLLQQPLQQLQQPLPEPQAQLQPQQAESSAGTEIAIVQPVFPQPAVLIPRAIRHAPPKKRRPFWARWFA